MRDLQKAVADLVRRKMNEKGWSNYDVERQSGGVISHATVWSISNGTVKDVKLSTLQALAKGLQISEYELLSEVFGLGKSDSQLQLLTSLVSQLPSERQAEVIEFARLWHKRYSQNKSITEERTERTMNPQSATTPHGLPPEEEEEEILYSVPLDEIPDYSPEETKAPNHTTRSDVLLPPTQFPKSADHEEHTAKALQRVSVSKRRTKKT